MNYIIRWIIICTLIINSAYGRISIHMKISVDSGLSSEDPYELNVCISNPISPCIWRKFEKFEVTTNNVEFSFDADDLRATYLLDGEITSKKLSGFAKFQMVAFAANDDGPQYLNSNGGPSVDLKVMVSHTCKQYFYGDLCNKMCIQTEGEYSCDNEGNKICSRNYTKVKDQCYLDKCNLSPSFCQNNGLCQLQDNGEPFCKCKKGFTGSQCKEQDLCANTHCLNGGTCSSLGPHSVQCLCPPSYGGEVCERFLRRNRPITSSTTSISHRFITGMRDTTTENSMKSVHYVDDKSQPIEYPPTNRNDRGVYFEGHETVSTFPMQKSSKNSSYQKLSVTTFIVIGTFCLMLILLSAVGFYVFKWRRQLSRNSNYFLTNQMDTIVSGLNGNTYKQCPEVTMDLTDTYPRCRAGSDVTSTTNSYTVDSNVYSNGGPPSLKRQSYKSGYCDKMQPNFYKQPNISAPSTPQHCQIQPVRLNLLERDSNGGMAALYWPMEDSVQSEDENLVETSGPKPIIFYNNLTLPSLSSRPAMSHTKMIDIESSNDIDSHSQMAAHKVHHFATLPLDIGEFKSVSHKPYPQTQHEDTKKSDSEYVTGEASSSSDNCTQVDNDANTGSQTSQNEIDLYTCLMEPSTFSNLPPYNPK